MSVYCRKLGRLIRTGNTRRGGACGILVSVSTHGTRFFALCSTNRALCIDRYSQGLVLRLVCCKEARKSKPVTWWIKTKPGVKPNKARLNATKAKGRKIRRQIVSLLMLLISTPILNCSCSPKSARRCNPPSLALPAYRHHMVTVSPQITVSLQCLYLSVDHQSQPHAFPPARTFTMAP